MVNMSKFGPYFWKVHKTLFSCGSLRSWKTTSSLQYDFALLPQVWFSAEIWLTLSQLCDLNHHCTWYGHHFAKNALSWESLILWEVFWERKHSDVILLLICEDLKKAHWFPIFHFEKWVLIRKYCPVHLISNGLGNFLYYCPFKCHTNMWLKGYLGIQSWSLSTEETKSLTISFDHGVIRP